MQPDVEGSLLVRVYNRERKPGPTPAPLLFVRRHLHLVRITETANTFVLEASGSHGEVPVFCTDDRDRSRYCFPRRRANPGRYGVMQVLTRLEQQFVNDTDMLAVLPNRTQIPNQKAYLWERLIVRFEMHAVLLE